MVEEKNKNTAEQKEGKEEKEEEKEFLAREEVKTMKKDIAKIRETEAHKERERLSKIKTAEEAERERIRKARAEKEAQARESAEKEAQKKQEETKRSKEERKEKEVVLEKEEAEKEELKAKELKETLRQTQAREEEEREKFLKRVEAKAQGKEEMPLMPLKPPSPIPAAPPEPAEKPTEPAKPFVAPVSLPKKKGGARKLGMKIVLSLLMLAILGGVGTFWYWYLIIREEAPSEPIVIKEEAEKEEVIIPPALISITESQTLRASQLNEVSDLLSQELAKEITEGQFTRILIEDTSQNKILGLQEFFNAFSVVPPENFYNKLGNDFTLFIYSQEEGTRLGFVAEIKEEGLAELLTSWEGTMEQDFENLFTLFGKDYSALVSYFRETTSQEIPFRFQTFSRQDLGIVYTIYNDYFIFTNSWKSMEKALQKLKEEPVSLLPFSPNLGAEFILENLTLEEKIGQLFLIGVEGETLTPDTKKLIQNVKPGGILLLKKNISNEAQTKALIQDLQETSLACNGLPLLISVDQEGGEICSINFSQEKTAQSELKDTEQAYEVGYSRGAELRSLGINVNFAPVLDAVDPGDFLFDRSFQKDTKETSLLAQALILGQKQASIATAIKHFPGYSDIDFNPEKQLAVVEEIPEIQQFQNVMGSQPELVMVSNVVYSEIDPDLPFALSPKGIQLLKKKLGNDCVIITDDLPQYHLTDTFSLKGIVTLPIKAGVDILTFSNNGINIEDAVNLLYQAVLEGEISEERINESVLKIINLKQSVL